MSNALLVQKHQAGTLIELEQHKALNEVRYDGHFPFRPFQAAPS